jgi:hypothetical protein
MTRVLPCAPPPCSRTAESLGKLLIVSANSVSRERLLILNAKPISAYDEKAVSSERLSQCSATGEVVKAGSLLPLALFYASPRGEDM